MLEAERRGELLTAFDVADRALEQDPENLWLRHRAVLALARAGSTTEAARRFADYGLAGVDDEDVAALEARIAKDVAFEASDAAARARGAAASADLYEAIFRRTGGYYPAVNAASLYLIAGQPERARALARQALAAVAASADDSYYTHATIGEAQLVLGDLDAARAALESAVASHAGDYGALASTRRQLRFVGAGDELLRLLAGPGVVHFCGHRIAAAGAEGRFPSSHEAQVADAIRARVAARPPGFAYGALASGADILWAEALVDAGVELHVVLPFATAEFVHASVAEAGAGWVERFESCLAAASSVTHATDDAYLGDDVLYSYGSELAMGLALLRARYLEAGVWQWALWDGLPASGAAGTAVDVARWRQAGGETEVVPVEGVTPVLGAEEQSTEGRVVRALLFADIKGFSQLRDEQAPRFARHVLGAFADVLERYGDAVEQRNTWGDALYVVMSDVSAAAACAYDLQEAMETLDLPALGLPDDIGLRLGAHTGPVFAARDPVLDAPAFIGSHVSRTARIEPVTPPGAIYVTEAFAAALALARGLYTSDYVGHMPAAKDFGRLRMYRLRRRPSG